MEATDRIRWSKTRPRGLRKTEHKENNTEASETVNGDGGRSVYRAASLPRQFGGGQEFPCMDSFAGLPSGSFSRRIGCPCGVARAARCQAAASASTASGM